MNRRQLLSFLGAVLTSLPCVALGSDLERFQYYDILVDLTSASAHTCGFSEERLKKAVESALGRRGMNRAPRSREAGFLMLQVQTGIVPGTSTCAGVVRLEAVGPVKDYLTDARVLSPRWYTRTNEVLMWDVLKTETPYKAVEVLVQTYAGAWRDANGSASKR
jgi:hypothetical protein